MAHRSLARLDPVHLSLDRTLLVAAVALGSSTASAHIELVSPPARYTPNFQQDDPCGQRGSPPGKGSVATYEPGQTITLEFNELLDHSSHFRVALDLTGTDNFTSPGGFEDFYNSPEVLLDDIADTLKGGLHEVEVTLPDTLCDPCTLQLIQVRTDDSAWGPGNDDLYFQCSDIVIAENASEDESSGGGPGEDTASSNDSGFGLPTGTGTASSGDTTDGADDESSGCACRADQRPGSGAPWLVLALMAWRRRRHQTATAPKIPRESGRRHDRS